MSDADREKWDSRYRQGAYEERTHPSALLESWIDRLPPGRALDLACGAGRNALFLARHGFEVDAVDISPVGLERVAASAAEDDLPVNCIEHDLDQPLHLAAEYQLILVIRFVDLSRIRQVCEYLPPGGFLVCEEHLVSDGDVIGPSNPAFRVQPGALAELAEDMHVEHVLEDLVMEPDGRQAALAQLIARL